MSYGQPGTRASFDLEADLSGQGGTDGFYALPFPSDLRLTPGGFADWRAFPVPKGVDLVEAFRQIAQERSGFSTVAMAWQCQGDGIEDPHAWLAPIGPTRPA